MTFRVQKSDGVIIETEDGDFIFPSFDMAYPDVDEVKKFVGKGPVNFNGERTRIERVERVTGWFGALDGSRTWHFDKNKATLEKLLRDEESMFPEAGDDDEDDEELDEYDDDDDDGDPFGADDEDDD